MPVIVTCFVIVALHRGFSWLIATNNKFSRLVEGNKILMYEKGMFNYNNMKKGLIGEHDVKQGVRRSALTNDMENVDKVYMERNGEISVIKK